MTTTASSQSEEEGPQSLTPFEVWETLETGAKVSQLWQGVGAPSRDLSNKIIDTRSASKC